MSPCKKPKNEFQFLTQDICREIGLRGIKQSRAKEGKVFKKELTVSDVRGDLPEGGEVDSRHWHLGCHW